MKPGWRRVKFGDVVRLSKESSKDPAADGLERYVGLEHIEPGDLRIRSWGDIADGTTFTKRFRPGQVLFGKRRAYQRKVAVADCEGVCSGDIYVFESKDPGVLLPELLPFVCQTDAFFDYAVGTSAGSLSPRTNWKSLAEYELALPPLEQQNRLISILRAAMSAQDKSAEAERRAKILHQRAMMDLTLPMCAALHPNHTICSVPERWQIRTVAQLCSHRSDLVIGPFGSDLKLADYGGRSHGVPVLFVRDIRPNRFEYLSDCFVDGGKAEALSSHASHPGDLLITKMGVPEAWGIPPGLAAVHPEGFPKAIVTADVVRVRLNEKDADARYVAFALNSAWGRQQTWRISPGSTTRFKMTLENVSKIKLPIPPVQYQKEAVEILTGLQVQLERLGERRSCLLRLNRSLFSSLSAGQ